MSADQFWDKLCEAAPHLPHLKKFVTTGFGKELAHDFVTFFCPEPAQQDDLIARSNLAITHFIGMVETRCPHFDSDDGNDLDGMFRLWWREVITVKVANNGSEIKS